MTNVLKRAVSQIVGIVGVVAVSSTLQAASFDCTKATAPIEKMICESPPVSNLDEQLAVIYKTALEKATDKDTLKKQQRIWIKEKRNACKDASCLFEVYQQRLIDLRKLSAGVSDSSQNGRGTVQTTKPAPKAIVIPEDKRIENQKLPLTFKLVSGDSYPLCQPYVDMLNKTKYMEYPSCERKLLPEFKQFKSIGWTEVTNRQEIERILYDDLSLKDARHDRLKKPEHEKARKRIQESIDSGKTRLYFYYFDFDKDGVDEIIYKKSTPYARGPERNGCDFIVSHMVSDKKVSINNVANRSQDNYNRLGLDGSDFLFLFNDGVINSLWDHYGDQYSIELWSVHHYEALCKINVQ